MHTSNRTRTGLLLAGFLGFAALPQQGYCTWHYNPPQLPQTSYSQGTPTIQWPSNSINVSQLEQVLSQNQGGPLNIQFPNQLDWLVNSDSVKGLMGNVQQEAQAMGVSGKLPDLSFSSLAESSLGGGGPQLSIPDMLQGNVQGQVDDIMRQIRYQEMNLSGMLPDWLKACIVAIYDAIYSCVDYIQTQMMAYVMPLFR